MLISLAVVAGSGVVGRVLWGQYEDHRDREASRAKIDRACARLVDPDAVLALRGGAVRVKPDSDGATRIGTPGDRSFHDGKPTGSCRIYRVGEPGTTYAHFELLVAREPGSDYANIVGSEEGPFERHGWDGPSRDMTRRAPEPLPQPLADGRSGYFTDDSVVVRARCKGNSEDETSLFVRATAPDGEDVERVTESDRLALADMATRATRKAAHKLGCRTRVAAPPHRLPEPPAKLGEPEKAAGACAWYARLVRESGRGELPDRALGAQAGSAAWQESCLLGVSPSLTTTLWNRHEKLMGDTNLGTALSTSPWWMQFESYFRDAARDVVSDGLGRKQVTLRPGTAGSINGLWWASSTCRGEPAVHVMTSSYPYERVVAQRAREALRAYVSDVAERRDCTDVKLPPASAFQDR